jgi:GTP-binding protein YchF
MNLKLGIVGLPNVGKSTLFNALTKSAQADAQNFPFCTIDPNVGLVEVPDKRIDALVEIVKPEKVQRSVVEFVDIAGLVEGASTGEGLGNKFLANIRECNAICHVVRDFENSDIHHVAGTVDPSSDFSTILTELILADLESVNKQAERVGKKTKSGNKAAIAEFKLLTQVKDLLEDGKLAKELVNLSEDEEKMFKSFHLLTAKDFMIVANTSEDDYAGFNVDKFREKLSIPKSVPVVPICAKIEAELVDLTEEEAQMFLEEIGATSTGIENLIAGAFELLGLQSYFTAGVTEVRAWTIYKGDTAPKAAGAIHGDFERGFIKADVIAFDDFVKYGGEAGAKEAGKMKMQGKEYIVQDGDVMHFKFNV